MKAQNIVWKKEALGGQTWISYELWADGKSTRCSVDMPDLDDATHWRAYIAGNFYCFRSSKEAAMRAIQDALFGVGHNHPLSILGEK